MANQMKHLKVQKDNRIRKFIGKASLLIDKARVKLVETIPSEELKLKIATRIKDDNQKLVAVRLVDNEYGYKGLVAETIKDDDIKMEALKLFTDDDDKYPIINTMKDNDKKIEAIDGFNNIYAVTSVLKTINGFESLDNPEGINELLQRARTKEQNKIEYMKQQIQKAESIKKYAGDDKKITAIDSIESEYLKAEVAKTIKDDDKKIGILSKFNKEWSKEIIAKEIQDDDKKIEVLKSFSDELATVNIARTIKEDSKKLGVITICKYDIYKSKIAQTIQDDDKKMEALKFLNNDRDKGILVETIQDDDKKIEAFSYFENDKYIENSILLIQNEDKKLEMVTKKFSYDSLENFILENYSENEIAKNPKFQELKEVFKKVKKGQKTKDDSKKIELIDSIENENLKVEIIKTLNDGDKIIEYINKIKNENLKLEIIDSIKDKGKKVVVLQKLTPMQLKKFRNNCEDLNFIKENIEMFIENEGFEVEISEKVLYELYKKNNQVIKDIDFRILNPKYIELLGKDKINLISCYHDIQEQVLGLDDKECYIFSKCIDSYMEKMKTDEWTVLGQAILENMSKGEYSKLFESIENIEKLSGTDIEALTKLMQNDNWCQITNINEARDFDTIRKEKCNSIMQNKNSTIEQKREALIQKIFGHNYEYGKSIIEKFGEDIKSIADGDEKDYVRALKLIEGIENPDTLQEIYDECEFVQTDKTFVERALKNQYGKMFNEGLYKPKEEDLVEGYSNVYNAGTEFKIIMTSLGAYSRGKETNNYKEDWNRPAISTQHFCASYIRNDMIGTAPIYDICYGFSEMKEDSLMLSGNKDIRSSIDLFNSEGDEKYYTPDNQINNTTKYNEMDFRRIQGGEKKQPDYIIVFRKNGIIPNMDKAQIASKQWGDMPIVIVDVDECLKSENEKVNEMLKEYKENPTSELENKIKQKVKNNRVTNRSFCLGIDDKLNEVEHEEYEQEVKKEEKPKIKVSEEALEENYEKVTPNERKSEMSKIKNLYTRMKEIARGEEYGK